MASPDGSVARRFAVLALLLALAVSVAMTLRKGRIPARPRAEPTHHRHHHHLVPCHDVHADQVDPPLRGVRGPRRVARGAGRRRGHRRGDEVAAQPHHVRCRRAVRDGVVVRQRQRLVVRVQLRRAMVESVPGVALRVHDHPARPSVARASGGGVVPLLRPRRSPPTPAIGAGAESPRRRWRSRCGRSSSSRWRR